jgi:predicted P-loop ATPase
VNPLVLVFCGGKNVGKTEWFRRLLPDELKPYMAESKLDDGKDSEIMMTDKILIMDDEYGGKSKRDAKKLKEISSKDYFTVRPAYGRTSIRIRRLASLCGTSNEYDVINDITGNRRVIPVKINSINHKAYNEIDKVALFMEGYRIFKEWEQERKWELKADDIKYLNDSTSDFEEVRIELEMFHKYFEKPTEQTKNHAVFMQTTEIVTFIHDRHKIMLSIKRMGAELRALEIEKKPGKGKNRGQKGYYLVKKNTLETDKAPF